jgi:TrmH family RNA methyltransferase
MELISSTRNPRIKQVEILMAKASERRRQNLFVIEGMRELSLALHAGYAIERIFVCPILCAENPMPAAMTFEVTEEVFAKLAYRSSSDGILAVARQRTHIVEELKLDANPFVIIIEGIEKPGNVGAILRTADAAAAAVIVCSPLCDLYNPNTIRASIGALFTTKIACCSAEDAHAFLTKNNIQIMAAQLNATQWYYDANMRQPTAIALGSEAHGLSEFWLRNSHSQIKIPMQGAMDSLNVSVSAAVITFEAMRQRHVAA